MFFCFFSPLNWKKLVYRVMTLLRLKLPIFVSRKNHLSIGLWQLLPWKLVNQLLLMVTFTLELQNHIQVLIFYVEFQMLFRNKRLGEMGMHSLPSIVIRWFKLVNIQGCCLIFVVSICFMRKLKKLNLFKDVFSLFQLLDIGLFFLICFLSSVLDYFIQIVLLFFPSFRLFCNNFCLFPQPGI